MMWHNGWAGAWGWIFGPLIMLAFWGGFVALAVWIVRAVWRSGEPRTTSQNSLEIAKARYARGEITREQFEQLKKDLGG
jgi:putative membrane protein